MSDAEKRGPGRPPINASAADKLMRVRVTPEQFEQYNAAADALEISLSQWARKTLDTAAKRLAKRQR